MAENMYFDPSSFDFTSLVDVVEQGNEEKEQPYTTAKEVGPDGGFITDASDLFDSDDEQDEETEVDPNQDISDFVDRDAEAADVIKIINDLDDEALLDIAGTPMSKGQIKELKQRAERVDQQSEYLDKATVNFEQANEWIEMQILTKEAAIDKNIKYLENMRNHPNISDTDYKKFSRDLEEAKAMKEEINETAKGIVSVRKEQQKVLTARRFANTTYEMSQEFPQWKDWEVQIMDDALARGFSKEYLLKSWDTNLARTLLESYMFRKNKNLAATKARDAAKAKAAKSAPSSVSVSRKAMDEKAAKTAAIKKKIAKGDIDRKDMGAWFDVIPD